MNGLRTPAARFGGFSLVGAANTLLSVALVSVLNELCGIDYRVSYIVSYALTVLLAYVVNARLVFGAPLSAAGAVGFFAAYLSGMVFGVGLLWLLRRCFPLANATLLTCAAIPATMVWNFFFVNRLLSGRKVRAGQGV